MLSQSNTLIILYLIFSKEQEYILKFYLTTWKDNALRLNKNVEQLDWVHHIKILTDLIREQFQYQYDGLKSGFTQLQ